MKVVTSALKSQQNVVQPIPIVIIVFCNNLENYGETVFGKRPNFDKTKHLSAKLVLIHYLLLGIKLKNTADNYEPYTASIYYKIIIF